MSNRARYSKRLLAFSVGISCCFSTLSASAQQPVLSSEEIIQAFEKRNSESRLRNISAECNAPTALEKSQIEFAQSLLAQAELAIGQVTDPEQKSTLLFELGKGYACTRQKRKASELLAQAKSYTSETNHYVRAERFRKIAQIYSQQIGDIGSAQALLDEARDILKEVHNTVSKYELFNLAEAYSEIGDIETMNALLAEATPLIEVDPEITHSRWYSELPMAGRLYAQSRQFQELRSLLDATTNPYVKQDIIAEAITSIAQSTSPAERGEISRLFPDFEVSALFRKAILKKIIDTSSRPSDEQAPNEQIHPYRAYRIQLVDVEVDNLASADPAAVDTFIEQQREIIAQIPSQRVQAVAYAELGEYLSFFGQPRVAIDIFAESQQQFADNADEQSAIEPSDLRDVTEESHAYDTAASTAKALIRAGEFEQGLQILEAFDTEQLSHKNLVYSLSHIGRFTESSTFSLPKEEHIASLIKAQSYLPQLSDRKERFEAIIDIADAYIELGEIDRARQLVPSIDSAFRAIEFDDFSQYITPEASEYGRVLILLGNYEQAIAIAEATDENSDAWRKLPAQFVAVGEYERANQIRAGLPTSGDRLMAGRYIVMEYQEKGLLEEAIALTKDLLNEVQNTDLAAEAEADVPGINRTSFNYPMGIERERIDRVGQVVNLYLYSWSNIDRDILSAEEIKAIGFELIASIEEEWLRSAVIEDQLTTEDAIAMYERDQTLKAPDNILLLWATQQVDTRDFSTAISAAENMRSPYATARMLAYIATQYMAYQ